MLKVIGKKCVSMLFKLLLKNTSHTNHLPHNQIQMLPNNQQKTYRKKSTQKTSTILQHHIKKEIPITSPNSRHESNGTSTKHRTKNKLHIHTNINLGKRGSGGRDEEERLTGTTGIALRVRGTCGTALGAANRKKAPAIPKNKHRLHPATNLPTRRITPENREG